MTDLQSGSGSDCACGQAVRVDALVLQDLMLIPEPVAPERLSQPMVQLRVPSAVAIGMLRERADGS